MATKITETHTLDLMTILLAGIELCNGEKVKTKDMGYMLRGCEVIIEYKGQFYKISVEQFDAP